MVTQSLQQYQVYGLRLSSNLPLPELQAASFEEQDISFRYMDSDDAGAEVAESARLIGSGRIANGGRLDVYHGADAVTLRFEDAWDFQVSNEGDLIRCHPRGNMEVARARGILFGSILSLALHLRGVVNLHSSAVALPNGAFGFLGGSGDR